MPEAGFLTLPEDLALDGVFQAINDRAPHVLVELHGCQDNAAVLAWANRYRLCSDTVLKHVENIRLFWKHNPKYIPMYGFQDLSSFRSPKVVLPANEEDERWRRRQVEIGRVFPNPREQTLKEWLDIARRLYFERERIIGRGRLIPYHLDRHCAWFVDVQVLGIRPSLVARLSLVARVDRAAVERETKEIARLLGLKRRAWPRGRAKANVRLSSPA